MPDGTANIQINLTGDVFIAIQNLQAEFKQLINRVTVFEGDVKSSFNTLNTQVSKFKTGIKQISFAAIADNVRNVTDGFKEMTGPGLQFEQQIADLSAITGVAGEDLKVLEEASRSMGKTSGIGASQAAEAFKLLASNIDIASIGGVQGLKALQKETITLSQAAGTDLPMAADTMSFALNQFQLPVSEAARVINTLGAGAKYGAAEIPDLAASLKGAGSVAHQAGVNIESTVGAIEVLSQRGIKGAEAGTMLRNVLLKLQTENIPGVNLKADGLSKSLGKMTNIVNDATSMEKIFGRENITAAQILISEAAAVQTMTDKVTGTHVAYEQAAIRTKTYKHELELVRAKVDDFKISIFNATGSMLPWAEYLMQAMIPLSQMIPLISAVGSGIKALTTAQWALNAAQLAMPALAIVAGLAVIGAAVYSLTRKYDAASIAADSFEEAQRKVKESTFDERYETEQLLKVARDTKKSTEERTIALDKLKAKSAEFFGQMSLETIATEQGAIAFNKYAESIDKVALAEILREQVKERVKQQEEIRQNGPSHSFGQWLGKWEKLIYNTTVGTMLYGPGGVAKAAAITGADEESLANYQLQQLQGANEQTQNRIYNIESGYKTPSQPLVMAPRSNSQIAGSSNKGVNINNPQFKIEINTNNLDQSKDQVAQWVRDTLYSGIKDTSLIPSGN